MPLTGRAVGPARTLRLSPLVSSTAGELMAGELMSGRPPGPAGCELAVLIRRLASGTAARGWQASSTAALPDVRRSCCAPGSALAWFPATEARARAYLGRSEDDRLGE